MTYCKWGERRGTFELLLAQAVEVGRERVVLLVARVVEADGRLLLEGDLGVVVDAALAAVVRQGAAAHAHAGGAQLAPLLQRRQPARLLQLLLARLPLRLLALRVRQTSPATRQKTQSPRQRTKYESSLILFLYKYLVSRYLGR